MAHYVWLRWYVKLIQRVSAATYLEAILQPRLWPDEVQFGLVASTASQRHIVSSAVNVDALLNEWPIMAGYGGI
jgi:hypothetical protein